MTTTELLATFANPELMKSLTMGDRLSAGMVTTILGMGITFSALIILLFIISWMNKILNRAPAATAAVITADQEQSVTKALKPEKTENDNELVAAITTAIAMTLKTPTSNIVIKNIEKLSNQSPQWKRAGIIEQMNSRL